MRLRQKIQEMLRAQLIVAAVLTGGLQGLESVGLLSGRYQKDLPA